MDLPTTFPDALELWRTRKLAFNAASEVFATAWRNAFLASRLEGEFERKNDADARVRDERRAAQIAEVDAEEAYHHMMWLRDRGREQ